MNEDRKSSSKLLVLPVSLNKVLKVSQSIEGAMVAYRQVNINTPNKLP